MLRLRGGFSGKSTLKIEKRDRVFAIVDVGEFRTAPYMVLRFLLYVSKVRITSFSTNFKMAFQRKEDNLNEIIE